MHPDVEVIIVGGGPAGLSGALVLGRCGRTTVVLDDHRPRNARSNAMHGFLGQDGTPPRVFLAHAWEEVSRYPTVRLERAEVKDVDRHPLGFRVTLATGQTVTGKKLLLATGLVDDLPDIPGLPERWGSSVFPCPFCDGWEYRGEPMAVYGCGFSAACGFARELLTWSDRLTLFTDGAEAEDRAEVDRLDRLGIHVEQRRIARLEGPGERLERVCLDDGGAIEVRALFVMTTQHQRTGFAEKLGCTPLTDGAVRTGPLQHTRVPGVYVAGNASTGLQSAILAAAEGFKAAYAINDELVDDHVRDRLGENAPQPTLAAEDTEPNTSPRG